MSDPLATDARTAATTDVTDEGLEPEVDPETAKQLDPIDELFTYHAPDAVQQAKYIAIRESAKALARVIETCCAPGPDRTAAIRKVREAVMTANASIATHNAAAALSQR